MVLSLPDVQEQNPSSPTQDELEQFEQEWIARARIDPVEFIHYVSGKRPARHHMKWLANIFDPDRYYINIIAPRDSAKSTISVYAMAWFIGLNPLATNGIVSVSSDQAQARMRMLRSIIGDTQRFKNVFPNIAIDDGAGMPNDQSEFSVKRTDMEYTMWRTLVAQQGSLKDPTIKIGGVGSRNLLGGRFSGILLLDDIQDEYSLGDENMDKLWRYLGITLFPCVMESIGKIVSISTRWQRGDICDRLKDIPLYTTIDIPAILYDDNGNRYSYWPEFWPLERLDRKKASLGDDPMMWELMYMNNPMASSDVLFRREWLSHDIPSPLPHLIGVYISTDQAVSMENRADWNVYGAIGEDADFNIYILDMIRFRQEQTDQLDTLANFCSRTALSYGRLDGILFEKVMLSTAFGQHVQNHEKLSVYPVFPVPIVGAGDKRVRAQPVSTHARNNRLFINQYMPDVEQLKLEYCNFGTYRWDDTLDMASLFFRFKAMQPTAAKLHVVRSRYLG